MYPTLFMCEKHVTFGMPEDGIELRISDCGLRILFFREQDENNPQSEIADSNPKRINTMRPQHLDWSAIAERFAWPIVQ